MNPWVRLCISIYRRLARAFPHEFWMIYGEAMERLGEDAAPEIWRRHGFFGLVKLVADIAARLPVEYLAELRQDARYALRTISQSRGFAAIAVVSLALGIGVCSTFFTQVEWLMRPVPALHEPQALMALEAPVSYPHFERYRDLKGVAASSGAFIGPVPFGVALGVSENGKAERLFGQVVSLEYFSTLGVQPASGRFFNPDTEKPGAAPVVVVTERFWRTHLDSDPRAVGRTLRVNGQTATIIGIGPKDFAGVWPLTPAELFVPVTSSAAIAPELADNALRRSDLRLFRVVLRLAPGVEREAAEAALDTVARQLNQEAIGSKRDEKGRQVRLILAGGVTPLTPEQRASAYGVSAVMGGLVLALACANLATLLLARGSDRRKEIAIRLSVGASRFRLVRQLLTESVMLSFAGGIGGLVVAYWFVGYLVAEANRTAGDAPSAYGYSLNFHSILFAVAVTMVAGVGFGLAPALASTRGGLAPALKEGAVTPLRGYRRFGLRNLLVGGQVAASLTILLLTSYLVVGYEKTTHIDPGFNTAGLYLFQLDPVRDGYPVERTAELFEKLPDRLSRIGAVTIAESTPLADLVAYPDVRVSASQHGGEQVLASVVRQRIGAHYFSTLGVPMIRGQEFDDRDVRENVAVAPAIVNQTAARELFGEANPVGSRIQEDGRSYAVIGVARDTKSAVLMAKPAPTMFLRLTPAQGAKVIVRGASGSDVMVGVREELAAMDSRLTILNARSLHESVEQLNGLVRLSSLFYMGLGVFGLILASMGLAGVTAYAVLRRRKEIGIRMALGARSAQVLRLVLKEGASLVGAGSVLGFAGAYGANRVLTATADVLAKAFGSSAGNPVLLIGVPLLLAALAMAACYVPARRSTRVDPMVALREE